MPAAIASHPQFAPPATAADGAQLIATARTLADAWAPEAARVDAERILPHAAFEQVRRAGISAARVPAQHGGSEVSYLDLTRIFTQLARGNSNVAQALIPHFTAVERIRLMGSPAQHRQLFADVLQGAIIAGGTSERGGKFRTDIATTLKRDGAGYRLDGVKFYSTGSLMADKLRVTALNEAGERVSVIIPRDRAGVVLEDDWHGMGQRVTASGTSRYSNVAVEESEVIPFAQWEAQQRNYGSSAAQLLHATIEIGIAYAALDDAIGWARRSRPVRESGVERSVDDPFIQHTIGNIAAHTHAAEASVERAAGLIDRAVQAWYAPAGQHQKDELQQLAVAAAIAVAEARIVAHEAGLRAAELLYEAGGASATLADHNFDRHWRNARTHTTHDPVSYKFKVVGDYYLNDAPPPISFYY